MFLGKPRDGCLYPQRDPSLQDHLTMSSEKIRNRIQRDLLKSLGIKGRHRRRRSFGENSLKMGTTKVLSDTFSAATGESRIESVLADYKPNLDSHIMVLPKPRLDRRSSMPDLRDFRCISSAVVYETIATLSSLGDARGLMVLPPCDQSSETASTSVSTPEILPGKQQTNEPSHKTSHKWAKKMNNYVQEETRAVLSCSPLIGGLSPFVDQLGSQKGRKTQRKEWVSKHASLKNLQKQILPTFSDSASQTDITRPVSAVFRRRNSLGSEGADSVYYDSLEEDDSKSSNHSSSNKAFYVPIKNNLSPKSIVVPTLPARLTARLEERKKASGRRALPNPLSLNNLSLTGKKVQLLNDIELAELASKENEKDVNENSSNLSILTLKEEMHASSDSDILDSPKIIETINNGNISPQSPDHSAETSNSDITQITTPRISQKGSPSSSINRLDLLTETSKKLTTGKSDSHSESASVQYSDTYTALSHQSYSSSAYTQSTDRSTAKDESTGNETQNDSELQTENIETNIDEPNCEEEKASTNTDKKDESTENGTQNDSELRTETTETNNDEPNCEEEKTSTNTHKKEVKLNSIDDKEDNNDVITDIEVSEEALPKESSENISEIPSYTNMNGISEDRQEMQSSINEDVESDNFDEKYDTDSFHSISNTFEKSEDDISEVIDSIASNIQNDENNSEIEIQITVSELDSNEVQSETDEISENISSENNNVSEDIPPNSTDEIIEETTSVLSQDQLEIVGYTSNGKEALLESGFIDYDDVGLIPDSPTASHDKTNLLSTSDNENSSGQLENNHYTTNESVKKISNDECFLSLDTHRENFSHSEDILDRKNNTARDGNGIKGCDGIDEENSHVENIGSNLSINNENELTSNAALHIENELSLLTTEGELEQEELSDETDSWDRITVIRALSSESNTGSRNDTPDIDTEFSLHTEGDECNDENILRDQVNHSQLPNKENDESKTDLLEEIFGNLTLEEGKKTPIDENSSGLSTIEEDDELVDATLTEPSEEEPLVSDDDRREEISLKKDENHDDEGKISTVECSKIQEVENSMNDLVNVDENPPTEVNDDVTEKYKTNLEVAMDTVISGTESEVGEDNKCIIYEGTELERMIVKENDLLEISGVNDIVNNSEEYEGQKVENEDTTEEINGVTPTKVEECSNSEGNTENLQTIENEDINGNVDKSASKEEDEKYFQLESRIEESKEPDTLGKECENEDTNISEENEEIEILQECEEVSETDVTEEDVKTLDTFREKIDNENLEGGEELDNDNNNECSKGDGDLDKRSATECDEEISDREHENDQIEKNTDTQETKIVTQEKENENSKTEGVKVEMEEKNAEVLIEDSEVQLMETDHDSSKAEETEGFPEENKIDALDENEHEYNEIITLDKGEASDVLYNEENIEDDKILSEQKRTEIIQTFNAENEEEAIVIVEDPELSTKENSKNYFEENESISENEHTSESNQEKLQETDVSTNKTKSENMAENDYFSNGDETIFSSLKEEIETMAEEIKEVIIEEETLVENADSLAEEQGSGSEKMKNESDGPVMVNETEDLDASVNEMGVENKNVSIEENNSNITLWDGVCLEKETDAQSDIGNTGLCNGTVNEDDALETDEAGLIASSSDVSLCENDYTNENKRTENRKSCSLIEDGDMISEDYSDDANLKKDEETSAVDRNKTSENYNDNANMNKDEETSAVSKGAVQDDYKFTNHISADYSSESEDCSYLTQSGSESSSQNGKDELISGLEGTFTKGVSCLMLNETETSQFQKIFDGNICLSSDKIDDKISRETVISTRSEYLLSSSTYVRNVTGSISEESSRGLDDILDNSEQNGMNECDDNNEGFDQGKENFNGMYSSEPVDEIFISESVSDTESDTMTAVENLVLEGESAADTIQNTYMNNNDRVKGNISSCNTGKLSKGEETGDDHKDISISVLKDNAADIVVNSISKAVSSLSICTDEVGNDTESENVTSKDGKNEQENSQNSLDPGNILDNTILTRNEDAKYLENFRDTHETEQQEDKHGSIPQSMIPTLPEDNSENNNQFNLKYLEDKIQGKSGQTIKSIFVKDSNKDVEYSGCSSLSRDYISESISEKTNNSCNDDKTTLFNSAVSKQRDNVNSKGSNQDEMISSNQESESEISDLSLLSNATQDVTEPIIHADYEELLDNMEGMVEEKVFIGHNKISRNFNSCQMMTKQREFSDSISQNLHQDQLFHKDLRYDVQEDQFCGTNDIENHKKVLNKTERKIDRDASSEGAQLPESFLEQETAFFDDDSPRNRSNQGGAAVNSPSSDSGVMEMIGKNGHSPVEGSREEEDMVSKIPLQESPHSEVSTRLQEKKPSSKKAKDRANHITSGRHRPVSAKGKELDVEDVAKKSWKSLQDSLENSVASEKPQVSFGGTVSQDEYHNLSCQNETDTSRSKYQLVQDYLDKLPNVLHSKDESPHVTVGSSHRSNDGMQTDNLSDFGSSESGGESYSERLLKALEARRTRRHRPPSSNIDHEEGPKNYRPPSLSALDAFLASLSRYRGGRDISDDSRDDTPSPSIPGGADDVTVHVKAGPRHHDVRVSSRRQVRLVVNVSHPGVASDSGFAPDTSRSERELGNRVF